MNLKMIYTLVIITTVSMLLWYTYHKGYDSGMAQTKADYQGLLLDVEANNRKAVFDAIQDHNKKVFAIRNEYAVRLREQEQRAKTLSEELAAARLKAGTIRESIRYIKSDCGNVVSDELYSMYERTRSLIIDPRTTDPNN